MAKSPTEDPLCKELDELRNKARASRRTLEPGWFYDLAFYQNKQWLIWAGNHLQQPEMPAGRITATENRITGCVQTELAKMTKNRPIFTVTPNTGDSEDVAAAELAERLMRYLWRHLRMTDLSRKALEWSRVCCAGFLKCYWDSSIGESREVLIGPDGKVLSGPDGRAMGATPDALQLAQALGHQPRVKRVAQGDIKVEVRSPFQMYVDPICDTFDEAEWAIEESIKSLEYARRRYGDAAKDLKEDTPANPGLIEQRMLGAALGQMSGGYNGVRIREYWAKPCVKYPQGVRVVWAQGQVLERDDKPFDPMPYVMLTAIPVPGRLWGMSVVELLRGPQTELNKVISQMRENANRVGNPTLLASKQSILDPEKFLDATAAPGGTFFFDETGSQHPVPQYLEAPTLPEYIPEERDRIIKAIEDISGQHEVTNANVPPGVTAASAITLLREADDTRLGLAMQDYEEQLGHFGRKVLRLAANFYSDNRTIRIAGDDGAWEIFDFKGAMLKGNTHVDVQAGSAFPQSQATKQAQLTDWLRMMAQMGVQLDPRQIAQYLRDVGLGATDRLVAEFSASEQQANRENALIVQGQVLNINPQDDDQAHIANHEEFERAPRFFQLPPEVQQHHQLHVAAHRERLSEQQQHQLEMQMKMAGQVPPTLSQAAFQDEQQLSQLQGTQQLQLQQSDHEQKQQASQMQQGFDQAGAEQKQRQAEEEHRQRLQHAEEQHQVRISQQQEQHLARLKAMQQQSQQRPQGGPNGRRNA